MTRFVTVTIALLGFATSATAIRENRTVSVFELLNDVFASSEGVAKDKPTPVKTLEGVSAFLCNTSTMLKFRYVSI